MVELPKADEVIVSVYVLTGLLLVGVPELLSALFSFWQAMNKRLNKETVAIKKFCLIIENDELVK